MIHSLLCASRCFSNLLCILASTLNRRVCNDPSDCKPTSFKARTHSATRKCAVWSGEGVVVVVVVVVVMYGTIFRYVEHTHRHCICRVWLFE